jgi:hypothetical protein
MKITDIDNIAYKLYSIDAKKRLINKNIDLRIELFIIYKNIFIDYYKNANIILRKEKINEINEKLL